MLLLLILAPLVPSCCVESPRDPSLRAPGRAGCVKMEKGKKG